ncbi:MAG: hypothetical protein ACOC1K_00890 [Nanoarchaeota archaeon]
MNKKDKLDLEDFLSSFDTEQETKQEKRIGCSTPTPNRINDVEKLRLESDVFADGSRAVPFINVNTSNYYDYIPWRDTNSDIDYPLQLLRLYKNSVLHSSILNLKAELITGNGLKVKKENDPKRLETEQFIKKINNEGDNLNNILYKLSLDYVIFNWFNTQLRFSKDWGKIIEVTHLETNKLRIQKPDENGEINGVYWKFDWGSYRRSPKTYLEKFDFYNYLDKKNYFKEIEQRTLQINELEDVEADSIYTKLVKEKKVACYSYKKYKPNEYYYPTPDYVAGITEIEADISSSVYGLNSLKNGMDNGMMFSFPGDLTDKETQKFAVDFMKNYVDGRLKGQPLLNFFNDRDQLPEVTEFGNGASLAQKYRQINQEIQNKIIMVHQIPSGSMIGIQVAGKLGNTNENAVLEEVFYNRVIKPAQEKLEGYFNKIMEYNELAEIEIDYENVFNQNRIDSEEAGIIYKE